MGIQKHEFYEGAALHRLVRGSTRAASIDYLPPRFIVDDRLQLYLKYSTAKRSPWGFTFVPDEQRVLREHAAAMPLIIGLICGADGVATVPYEDYITVAAVKDVALHLACRRNHRERYEVSGPGGILPRKIAPSNWGRLLKDSERPT